MFKADHQRREMEILAQYFEGLVFYRVDERESYTIYAANVTAGALADGKLRHVVVFVPSYLATQNKGTLRELQWHNLQTRLMAAPAYGLFKQKWDIARNLADIRFRVVQRDKNSTTYAPERQGFPFEMVLLHDPKKKSLYQHYSNVGLIGSLLEFRCVLNFKGEFVERQTLLPKDPGVTLIPQSMIKPAAVNRTVPLWGGPPPAPQMEPEIEFIPL